MVGACMRRDERASTRRMLSRLFDSKAFWTVGILSIFFALGMVPLVVFLKELDAISIARVLCVAVILTLGVDPVLGTPFRRTAPLQLAPWSSTLW